LLAAASLAAMPAAAQDRSGDNAVTQAEDAFGFSVGRETLGIYNSGNVRGFSPSAAGNVRIDGLYFDPAASPPGAIVDSTSIKVGLTAQGYPFTAPSGIVDLRLRRPEARAGASFIVNADSYGSYGIEADGSLPITPGLALGYGITGNHVEFPDGTNNWNHSQSLILRWRPAPGIEIMPFWTLANDYNDEAGTFYVPAGSFLPPQPQQRRFDGPSWSDIRYTATNQGIVASAALATDWLVRLGAFRSVFASKTSFTNLLAGEQPDGSGERLLIADPPFRNVSLSGELRLTHSIADGPRLHVIHFSLRERDARHEFGGSDERDLGPGRLGSRVDPAEPVFAFGPLGRDHVRQATYAIAYDGRWKGVGELSFGVSRADYRKTILLPGAAATLSRSQPFLYNGTIAANLSKALIVYGGYSRGLEESGAAPPGAANRNQPLPAILTEQKDVGIRLQVTSAIKAVAGLFDLSRPYFGFDAANLFTQLGTTRSRGAEFSITGRVTDRLDLVAGGVFLRPRVESAVASAAAIGPRPIGLPGHVVNLNLNWRAPFLAGLQLDLALVHRGAAPATTDNKVSLPPFGRVDLGGHYRFRLAKRNATLRVQMGNVFDVRSFALNGPGTYSANAGRNLTGYFTIDI
jgi:iron complex outermembrane receptor protein